MLTREENEFLTETGPGSPCGALMRAYWQPAAVAEELPPGGPPLPIRLLGEDLVLFRVDEEPGARGQGPGLASTAAPDPRSQTPARYGLLGLHCSHRGADLSYGRLEDGGLRCIYHGWLYDSHGRCLEQPGEPASQGGLAGERGSASADPPMAAGTARQKIQHRAYPCLERAGIVFAYLGPGAPPPFPAFEFLTAPDDRCFATKIFQECNYLQANEGNLDPVHNSFLHRRLAPADGSTQSFNNRDTAPTIELETTDFGLRLYSIRRIGLDRNAVKIINFVLPNLASFPAGEDLGGYSVNWHVPIDDEHHWKYVIQFQRNRPLDKETIQRERADLTPDYRLIRNQANRYGQDRLEMQSRTFTGMGYLYQVHDAYATEGEAAIQDRAQEHLGYGDRAVVAARQILLGAVRRLQAEGPVSVAPPTDEMVVRNTVLPASVDWMAFWKTDRSEPRAFVPR